MQQKKCCLILLFSFISFAVTAQYSIKGRVTGIDAKPLPNVSVIATKTNSTNVIAFAITDNDGKYLLIVNEKYDSIKLGASLIGFANSEVILFNGNDEYNFRLTRSELKLKEVIVKRLPIYQNKDTLNYVVNAFTSKQDRVIGDVIKKLPGIEVQSDGTIFYQGKPIQKYFINGLDLLEGRYNLANNNLPADAVKDIQVIENDQPIRILDSLVFSDRASLNLRLKRFITTGFAKVGIGAAPLLWDANVTPMTFNKSFQTINSFQANNIGKDVSRDLQTLTIDDLFNQQNKPGSPLLFIQPLSHPPFDKQWWLRNNVHLFSSNMLKKLKNELQLKTNVYFLNDHQNEFGSTKTTLITQNEIIPISEIKENRFAINKIGGSFILEKNTPKIYFKNNLQVQGSWNNSTGNLLNTNEKVYQNLHNQDFDLSNNFGAFKAMGKQLINIISTTNYSNLPENLIVTPGQFDDVLNNKLGYEKVLQHVRMNYFQTNNYIGFTKGLGHFTLMPKFGFQIKKQQLFSYINAYQQNGQIESDDNFKNNLSFLRTNLYGVLNAQYNTDIWSLNFGIPISLRYFSTKNSVAQKNNEIIKLTAEPTLDILYKMSQFLQVSVYSKVNNSFGEASQLYNTYILQSYRNLQRFNTSLPEIMSLTNGLYFKYKNPLNSTFATFGYNRTNTRNNLIFTNKVNSDGSVTLESILKNNFQKSQSVNVSASKYFSKIKTIFKIGGGVNFENIQQIINQILSNIHSNNYTVSFNVNNNFSKFLSFIYDGRFSIQKSSLGDKNISSIHFLQQSLDINFYPLDNQMLTVNSKYYSNNMSSETNRVFINLFYRYTFPKKKIDVDLNCNNLLNTKYFTTTYSESFLSIQNSFKLRPRQILISVRFSF